MFSHFVLGWYYSRRNIVQLKEKKNALGVAAIVLLGGLYFAVNAPQLAPYFLVVLGVLSTGGLGLSAVIVVLFEKVLGASITDISFVKIIAFWSILHITSTLSLSKFNPRVLKNFFYPAAKRV